MICKTIFLSFDKFCFCTKLTLYLAKSYCNSLFLINIYIYCVNFAFHVNVTIFVRSLPFDDYANFIRL